MAIDTPIPKVYIACVNGCGKSLEAGETYICQQCNDEIDRQADEVIGNAEDDDG
ncbi:hypothetical protein ROV06_000309 [Serratia marcescens]|uniref:hypothetical protein n=1 Tax=Serratia marcescens TaxID=615 RepID=UPI00288DA40F|nr:hypothetical protein [Serratia marcescens]